MVGQTAPLRDGQSASRTRDGQSASRTRDGQSAPAATERVAGPPFPLRTRCGADGASPAAAGLESRLLPGGECGLLLSVWSVGTGREPMAAAADYGVSFPHGQRNGQRNGQRTICKTWVSVRSLAPARSSRTNSTRSMMAILLLAMRAALLSLVESSMP